MQEDLFSARKNARETDPITSKIAAAMRKAPRDNHRVMMLTAFLESKTPLSDRQAFHQTAMDEFSCWWKRASELRRAELITPVDRAICEWTGTNVMRCVITDCGRVVMNERQQT